MPPSRKRRLRNGLRSLNERELRFCACYLRLTNGTKAAIAAGYSPRSAYNQASRLMKKDEVLAEIARLRAGRDELTVLDTAYVIENLMRIAVGEDRSRSHSTRVRALVLLGKHLGMFRGDAAPPPTPPTPPPMSEEEKLDKLNRLMAVLEARRAATQTSQAPPELQSQSPAPTLPRE